MQLETDAVRLKAVIEKERQRSNKLEEEYQLKIEGLQQELREAHQRRELDQLSFKQ